LAKSAASFSCYRSATGIRLILSQSSSEGIGRETRLLRWCREISSIKGKLLAMIRMEQPSFCFNSVDIGWPGYKMWKTVTGWEGMTPIQLAAEVMSANLLSIGIFGCSLRNIILNSHGFAAGLHIGGVHHHDDSIEKKPMYETDLGVFRSLKPFNVGTIWLVSCKAARGQYFCRTLANVTGTQVIASDGPQEVTAWQAIQLVAAGRSFIDDYEGNVFAFTPDGAMRRIDPEKDIRTVQESRW
jgi:hypothetical protein